MAERTKRRVINSSYVLVANLIVFVGLSAFFYVGHQVSHRASEIGITIHSPKPALPKFDSVAVGDRFPLKAP
jgi:hypothetical protein